MSRKSDQVILELLSKEPGPAPWYVRSLSHLQTGSGRCLWRLDTRELESNVRFRAEGGTQPVLALGMYARAFPLPPGLLGIWWPDGTLIRIAAIDCEVLPDLDPADIAKLDQAHSGFACGARTLAEFTIETALEPGEHPLDVPLAFAGLRDLIVVGDYAKVREAACAAVFEVRGGLARGSRRVCVFPQKWFNHDTFDIGYQWITRVMRDPVSNRLVGDGVRIGAFMLTEDGCHLERWLDPGVA